MRRRLLLVAVIALGSLFAACGGGDGTDDASGSEAPSVSGALAGALGSDECREAADKMREAAPAASGAVPDFGQIADAMTELKDATPGDLDDDVDVLVAAYRQVATDLSANGVGAGTQITPDNASKVASSFSAVTKPEYTTAATNLAGWTGRGCR